MKPPLVMVDNVSVGQDPETGWTALDLRNMERLGFGEPNVPDQRYLLDPKAALRVGCALIFGADPDLAAAVLRDVVQRATGGDR